MTGHGAGMAQARINSQFLAHHQPTTNLPLRLLSMLQSPGQRIGWSTTRPHSLSLCASREPLHRAVDRPVVPPQELRVTSWRSLSTPVSHPLTQFLPLSLVAVLDINPATAPIGEGCNERVVASIGVCPARLHFHAVFRRDPASDGIKVLGLGRRSPDRTRKRKKYRPSRRLISVPVHSCLTPHGVAADGIESAG